MTDNDIHTDTPPVEVRNEFQVHRLTEEALRLAQSLAVQFTICLNSVEALVGHDGREMAIVRTKLQEAAFYAKRALAVRKENQA